MKVRVTRYRDEETTELLEPGKDGFEEHHCPACHIARKIEQQFDDIDLFRGGQLLFVHQKYRDPTSLVDVEEHECLRRVAWLPLGLRSCTVVTPAEADSEILASAFGSALSESANN